MEWDGCLTCLESARRDHEQRCLSALEHGRRISAPNSRSGAGRSSAGPGGVFPLLFFYRLPEGLTRLLGGVAAGRARQSISLRYMSDSLKNRSVNEAGTITPPGPPRPAGTPGRHGGGLYGPRPLLEECGFLESADAGEIARRYDPRRKKAVLPSIAASAAAASRLSRRDSPRTLFLRCPQSVTVERLRFPEPTTSCLRKPGMSRGHLVRPPRGCRTVSPFPGCALPARGRRRRELFRPFGRAIPPLGIVLDCCGRISHVLAGGRVCSEVPGDAGVAPRARGVREVLSPAPTATHEPGRRRRPGRPDRLRVLPVGDKLPGRDAATVIHDPGGTAFTSGPDRSAPADRRGRRPFRRHGAREGENLCCHGAGVDCLSPRSVSRWSGRVRRRSEAHGRHLLAAARTAGRTAPRSAISSCPAGAGARPCGEEPRCEAPSPTETGFASKAASGKNCGCGGPRADLRAAPERREDGRFACSSWPPWWAIAAAA